MRQKNQISLGHEKNSSGVNVLIKRVPLCILYPLLCSSIKPCNLTMLQPSYSILRDCFMKTGGFPAFFNRFPQLTKVLKSVLDHQHIQKSQAQGGTNTRVVQTV